jgi:hypothetical protein
VDEEEALVAPEYGAPVVDNWGDLPALSAGPAGAEWGAAAPGLSSFFLVPNPVITEHPAFSLNISPLPFIV